MIPADLFAQSASARPPPDTRWDAGTLRHLLPTVSDTSMLIKASFAAPLDAEPRLRVGDVTVRGRMGDTRGEHWHFHATNLSPARRYPMSLVDGRGKALCQPWELSTFPAPDTRPEHFRVMFFSCAGGHEAMTFLPLAVRNRLLRRGLSFRPDAVVAKGDHVYWDLLAPVSSRATGGLHRGAMMTNIEMAVPVVLAFVAGISGNITV